MHPAFKTALTWAICLAAQPVVARAQSTPPAINAQAMVATVHPMATDAGVTALRQGGNAIDAAVAAALTLGVVDGHNSGIGGGCFLLIRRPNGRLVAIDGRETAPARAHRDMYLQNGRPRPDWSKTGALASGTPGALAAYSLAVQQHGRLPLARLIRPAAALAENGFALDRSYAESLETTADVLRQFPATRAVLLKSDGTPYRQGEVLRQPDLAATYRAIADEGPDWFYRGPFAAAVQTWMSSQGGVLAAADFASYRAQVREPLVSNYRGLTVVGFPPPSSGGIHVAQILSMLERFDLADLHAEHPHRAFHAAAEAMKLAFADRAHWLGDADFVAVPRGLLAADYLESRSALIELDRARLVESHGAPPRAASEVFGRHTTHVAAADQQGNWVALTATVNTTFGSKVIIPGTGVVMNNEMDDFSIQPGVPNAFGLVGAEANAIEPGKRPLSSMSPTIVLRDDEPLLTLGAAGGPTIINQVVLTIVRHFDLQLPIDRAVAAFRFHHQWSPDRLVVEARFPPELLDELTRLGHDIETRETIGVLQAIAASPEGLIGVPDPRVSGKAAGP